MSSSATGTLTEAEFDRVADDMLERLAAVSQFEEKPPTPTFAVGDSVSAQYRGKAREKYYPGKISAVNPDGTFNSKTASGAEG